MEIHFDPPFIANVFVKIFSVIFYNSDLIKFLLGFHLSDFISAYPRNIRILFLRCLPLFPKVLNSLLPPSLCESSLFSQAILPHQLVLGQMGTTCSCAL